MRKRMRSGKNKPAIRLAARIKDFDETVARMGPGRSRGFRKPGSNQK